MSALLLGCTMAAAVLVTMRRIMTFKTVFGYATPIDVTFTGVLIWMFHGTLAGMSGAAAGGLILAVALSIGQWLTGYRRLAVRRAGRFGWRLVWVEQRGVFGGLGERIANAIRQQITAAKLRAAT